MVHVDLQPGAALSGVLVKRRLEVTRPQLAPGQPVGAQAPHHVQQRPRVQVRRPHDLQRMRRSPPLRQRGPFDQHRTAVRPRHRQPCRIGAGIDPRQRPHRPAETRRLARVVACHVNHPQVHVQTDVLHEPAGEFPDGQPVAHRQRRRADKTLPAGFQPQPLDGAPGGIRPVQHPHRFAVRRARLQHVEKRGDERVDAAADVLQVHQQHVEPVQHGRRRAPHRAVQAVHRHPVHRVAVIGGFHHVVLLVAAHAVLRPEGARQAHLRQGGQYVEAVLQVGGHRGGMPQQCQAPPMQRRAQAGVVNKAVDAEADG